MLKFILLDTGPYAPGAPSTDLTSVISSVLGLINTVFTYEITLFGVSINCWTIICFGIIFLFVRFVVKVASMGVIS